MSDKMRVFFMTILLLGAALALHAVSHGEPASLAQPLSTFSPELANWQRIQDVPLAPEVVSVAGVDDYLYRFYQRPGEEPVQLYIGYYKSQRTGQTIHSPKNCLPGAGWQPVKSGRTELTLNDGKRVTVNSYIIEKGLERLMVLYWYQSHGRVIASEYGAKIYMIADALRLNRTDSAMIRITTELHPDEQQARQRAISFAQQVLENTHNLSPR